jgi:hypothetical protein
MTEPRLETANASYDPRTAMTMGAGGETIMDACRQWCSRPADERYLSLGELHAATLNRAERSYSDVLQRAAWVGDGSLEAGGAMHVDVLGSTRDSSQAIATHSAFGSAAALLGANAGYLRRVPSSLAAACMNWHQDQRDLGAPLAYVEEPAKGPAKLRAVTSQSYGRIYDHQLVDVVRKANEASGGVWKVPAASYAAHDPHAATTLYASDRDVFLFLVDEERPIEVDGDTLYRGFFAWNSETGAKSLGVKWFLYRAICDNRIVWGAEDVKEVRVRHSLGAPERWLQETAPMLRRYAEQSAQGIEERIRRAKALKVGDTDEDVANYLTTAGFTKPEAAQAVEVANREEGQARSLWDVIQGGTAAARGLAHQDARVSRESAFGKLLARC